MYDASFKIIIFGDSIVEKEALTERFLTKEVIEKWYVLNVEKIMFILIIVILFVGIAEIANIYEICIYMKVSIRNICSCGN